MNSIFDYPPVERKYVAVRKYRKSVGGAMFNRLLKRLGLSYYEFVEEYGEILMGDSAPNVLNKEIVGIIRDDVRRFRYGE